MTAKFFDSHVHFETLDGKHGISELIKRAGQAGVTRIIAVGGSPVLNRHAIAAARRFPGTVSAAIGWDRCQAMEKKRQKYARDNGAMTALWQRMLDRCGKLEIRVAALGEIGLDYYYNAGTKPAQFRMMRSLLAAARALRLPVIVHSREAEADTLALLEEHRRLWNGASESSPGVIHCFTGTAKFARRLLEMDYMLGFSGIVTFANADPLRRVAQTVPATRLLVETDTPYLAPAPYRGKRNEPAMLPAVLQRLAEVRGESTEKLAAVTRANAFKLFG